MLAPRVIEHTDLGSGVSLEVLEHVTVAAAAEACKPILDVSGITRLRHFAVVNDVEARLQLPVDDELDGARHLLIESGRVERQTVLPREHELLERLRTRQAADVGREEPSMVIHGCRTRAHGSSPMR
jgi:hypothetical protein